MLSTSLSDNHRKILVDSEKLPFDNHFFDIVISNQVIEHLSNQDLHMREINRILKKDGACYLSTSNKNSPIRGEHKGNSKVLKYRDMIRLFERNNFEYFEYSVNIVKQPSKYYSEIKFFKIIPKFLLNKMKYIFPSNIFIFKRKS